VVAVTVHVHDCAASSFVPSIGPATETSADSDASAAKIDAGSGPV
jgi:hypothetical protein